MLAEVQVVDMPLLFETGTYRWMWTNVFVTCDHGTEVSSGMVVQLQLGSALLP